MTPQPRPAYRAHHVALTVADTDVSVAFYGTFGFRPLRTWEAADGSLRISHLVLDGFVLELFCHGGVEPGGRGPLDLAVGNDLDRRGVKHLALHTADLAAAKEHLAAAGFDPGTPVTHGRTGIDYFFVRDPDGMWLEIVHEP